MKGNPNRRRILRTLGGMGIVGLTGCTGPLSGGSSTESGVQDSDDDGVIDSEDYAPRDPSVQRRSDINEDTEEHAEPSNEANTPTETEGADTQRLSASFEKVSAPPVRPGAMAWDGSHLWFGSSGYEESGNLFKSDLNGNIVESFTVEKLQARGLAHDGENLWGCGRYKHDDHDYSSWVVQISTAGEVLKEYNPEFFPSGATWADDGLWMSPKGESQIVKYETGDALEPRGAVGGDAGYITGIASDGSNFYTGANSIWVYGEDGSNKRVISVPGQYLINGMTYTNDGLYGISVETDNTENAILKIGNKE